MPTTTNALDSLALNGGTKTADPAVGMIAVKLSDAAIDAAVAVLRSGMLAQGKQVAAFEDEFAAATDAHHALACANGTCALQLAYGALGIDRGDTVLCPAWTYVATASMLKAAGANIVWVDADPDDYTIDTDDLKNKARANPDIKAIAATHIYGTPAHCDAIDALANELSVPVVYDAAQAHLATWQRDDAPAGLGAFGTITTYSFYPTKNMTTAEGGMCTTNDADLADKIRLLRSHGEPEKYTHTQVGFNYRMSDVSAAIGREQLKDLPAATERRRAIAAAHDAALADLPGLTAPGRADAADPAYHLYPVRVDADALLTPAEAGHPDKSLRDLVTAALNAEGVGTAIHYPRSLTRQPMFDEPGVQHQPVSDALARELFCIPVHQHLSDEQVAQVHAALRKVAGALAK
jgi:perosamine synthetase